MESKDIENLKDTEDAGSSGIAGPGDERAGPERYVASPRAALHSELEDHNIVEMPPDCSSPTELEPMRPHGEDCHARASISPPEPYRDAITGDFDASRGAKRLVPRSPPKRLVLKSTPKRLVLKSAPKRLVLKSAPKRLVLKWASSPPTTPSISITPSEAVLSRSGSTAPSPHGKDCVALESISPFMMPELYRAATTGDVDAFAEAVADDAESLRIKEVTPRGNSALHVAASFGHDRIVDSILQKCPDLVELKNRNDDLALHVAASSGHLNVVQSLVAFARESACGEGQNTLGALLGKVNRQGNTALHVALENRQPETALYLVDADPRVSYGQNKEGKSPVYMATKSGYLEIVEKLITKKDHSPAKSVEHNNLKSKEGGCSQGKSVEHNNLESEESKCSQASGQYEPKDSQLLHASIIGRNKDVIERIWSIDSSLIESTDEEGRTPLSLAASVGFVEGVCYILDKSAHSTYQGDRNRNGFFPIHWACRGGHIEIIDAFLTRCPDSAELLNEEGENILHVAAKNGRAKLVSWMLKLNKLDMLINEKDRKGFTPLHWAASNFHPKVVSTLTWDKRVKLEIMDNEGLTALDIAEMNIDSEATFRHMLTLTALKSANAPRSERGKREREMALFEAKTAKSSRKSPHHQVNTLLLVASLVATVTYACGFTLPGGNNDSDADPDPGMATLVRQLAFQVFLVSNTIALYSSIVVAVTLIWAPLGDLNLARNSLTTAVPFLGVALTAMSSAFICGVYLVVHNQRWLAIAVLTIGPAFTFIQSVIFFSLALPLSSKHIIQLMIWVTRSDVEKVIEV